MKRNLIYGLLALALVAAACTNQPQQPQDLSGLQQRLDDVGGRIDALRADVQQLQAAAVGLDAVVRANGNLDRLLGGLTGIVVETWPADVDVWIESGPCPDGIETPRYALSSSVVGMSYHAVPAGTYCIGSPETDELRGAGVTLTIPDGVVVTTTLYNRTKEGTP